MSNGALRQHDGYPQTPAALPTDVCVMKGVVVNVGYILVGLCYVVGIVCHC